MITHQRLLLIALLLLIFVIPSSHAMDNQTDELIESEEAHTAISMVDEDTLAASNDYYFNSSLENDNGDGSSKGNCNIHLTDGEYVLDDSKTIEKVNIIGSTPTKTIIKYDGVGFTVNSFLSLTNVTLTDISITNHGSVNATNTIFNYGYGSKADSYGNNYGGAIYTSNANANSKVTISNCTFNEAYTIPNSSATAHITLAEP